MRGKTEIGKTTRSPRWVFVSSHQNYAHWRPGCDMIRRFVGDLSGFRCTFSGAPTLTCFHGWSIFEGIRYTLCGAGRRAPQRGPPGRSPFWATMLDAGYSRDAASTGPYRTHSWPPLSSCSGQEPWWTPTQLSLEPLSKVAATAANCRLQTAGCKLHMPRLLPSIFRISRRFSSCPIWAAVAPYVLS